jgi:hypothetical protein
VAFKKFRQRITSGQPLLTSGSTTKPQKATRHCQSRARCAADLAGNGAGAPARTLQGFRGEPTSRNGILAFRSVPNCGVRHGRSRSRSDAVIREHNADSPFRGAISPPHARGHRSSWRANARSGGRSGRGPRQSRGQTLARPLLAH